MYDGYSTNANFKSNCTAQAIKLAEVPLSICGQTETMDGILSHPEH